MSEQLYAPESVDLFWVENPRSDLLAFHVTSQEYSLVKPGGFAVLWTKKPCLAIHFRRLGFELRDTILNSAGLLFLFRKPLSELTVAKQIVKTGTGALNIDKCRIRALEGLTQGGKTFRSSPIYGLREPGEYSRSEEHPAGRWPPNLLLLHNPDCKQVGEKKVKAPVINRFKDGMKPFGEGAGHQFESIQTGDAEGNEMIPVFECSEGCEVRALDNQSGVLKSGDLLPEHKQGIGGTVHHGSSGAVIKSTYGGDSGGASRFYPQLTSVEALRAWVFTLTVPENGLILGLYS